MKPILAADSIGKSFGTRRILNSARLDAVAGSVTLVLGRNGAGKSTLLKIAAGLIAADYGVVRFRERSFMRARLHELARAGLFFLPDRNILSPSIVLGTQLMTIANRFSGRAVDEAAEQLGIGHVLDRLPRTLSGGELRRAELCLATVRSPDCLIADEPLRGIDPRDSESILEHFRSLAGNGCAVVISGHDIKALMDCADRVIWVTSGTSYVLGNPEQALANERFRREYLTGNWT